MSWDIELQKDSKTIETDVLRAEGGTYQLGGVKEAELNVTYNYSKHFGFRQLDGMSANKAHDVMCKKIKQLKDDEVDNYWEPTEGNVKKALVILVEFAEFAINNKIEATFKVD